MKATRFSITLKTLRREKTSTWKVSRTQQLLIVPYICLNGSKCHLLNWYGMLDVMSYIKIYKDMGWSGKVLGHASARGCGFITCWGGGLNKCYEMRRERKPSGSCFTSPLPLADVLRFWMSTNGGRVDIASNKWDIYAACLHTCAHEGNSAIFVGAYRSLTMPLACCPQLCGTSVEDSVGSCWALLMCSSTPMQCLHRLEFLKEKNYFSYIKSYV